jgi:hypothetical protein
MSGDSRLAASYMMGVIWEVGEAGRRSNFSHR